MFNDVALLDAALCDGPVDIKGKRACRGRRTRQAMKRPAVAPKTDRALDDVVTPAKEKASRSLTSPPKGSPPKSKAKAKAKATCKATTAASSKADTAAGKQVTMTSKCVYSRAYHGAIRCATANGMCLEAAKFHAQDVAKKAKAKFLSMGEP